MHAHSREELKREWEDFKKKQEQQKAESSTAIKGLYQCRIDATEPLRRGEFASAQLSVKDGRPSSSRTV